MSQTDGKKKRRGKATVSFYKDVEVICKQGGHDFEGEKGSIVTGTPNSDGEFEVRFIGDDGRSTTSWVHGNDLGLADESASVTMSISGSPNSPLAKQLNAVLNGDLGGEEGRPYEITKAKIKDSFCHYSFLIKRGLGAGEEHNVKVDNIVSPDLITSFEGLNVHLAVIDDVFKHAGIEIENIDDYHNHELALKYFVTGFDVVGEKDNESVVLYGSKHLSSVHGRMDIKAPKVALDHLFSYKWYNELRDAITNVRDEVAQYKEGKFILRETEEEAPNPKQMKITDMLNNEDGEGDKGGQEGNNHDEELESSRVA